MPQLMVQHSKLTFLTLTAGVLRTLPSATADPDGEREREERKMRTGTAPSGSYAVYSVGATH